MHVELTIVLDRASDVPLWRQVAEAVRREVDDGTLRPGQRLPSTRMLASALGTSRIVVATGYEQLFAEGYLTARRGAGTFVAETSPAPTTGVRSGPATRSETAGAGSGLLDPFALAAGPTAAGEVTWRRALAAAARQAPLARDDPRGPLEVRRALLAHLQRTRGLVARPDAVLLTAGTTAALAEAGRLLLAGRRVAVEDPGYARGRTVLAAAGADPVRTRVDDAGLVVDELPARIAAVLCSPSHQFPLGSRLRLDRRRALLARARADDLLVVEDDYDSEFRYDVGTLPALASLDPDRVLYLGTASQVLGHDAGIGWAVGPLPVVDALAAGLAAHARPHPVVAAAYGRWLAGGEADREVRRAGRRHAAARRALVDVLTGEGLEVRGDAAGVHLVVDLPEGWSSAGAVAALADAGVLVRSLEQYGVAERPGLVLGYAGSTPAALREAAGLLCRVLSGRPR